MKYYPTYKDSNINWAMSIPATWKVQKIKYGLLFRQGGAWGTDPADNEFDCPCIRVADFDYAHLCVLDREYTVRTFVLDFVNSAEDIRAAFAPYYEETSIEETTDANIVYELKSKLHTFQK